jgi:hypothetical protein
MGQAYHSFGLYDLWDMVKNIKNLNVILGASIATLILIKSKETATIQQI